VTATGRHVRQPRPDLPWRQRPRPPLNLRDGGTSRTVLFVVGMIFGLLVGGLNELIDRDRASVWLGVAMLVAGLALAVLATTYVNRPPYR
jgi:hypothetical protein